MKPRIPIETEVGIINGRDAIYLESVQHSIHPSQLTIAGKLNTILCSRYVGGKDWIDYKIRFLNVCVYKCYELDMYGAETEIKSNFDYIQNPNWSFSLPKNYMVYVFSTYDYIYEIACSEYILEINVD